MAMKRYLSIIIVSLLNMSVVKAQSSSSEINAIKRDTTYITAENTNANREEAIRNAKTLLEVKVSEWVRDHSMADDAETYLAKTKEHCSLIETNRGNLIRAFVYVKKSDIFPMVQGNGVMVVKVAKAEVSKEDPQEQRPVKQTQSVVITAEGQNKPNPHPEEKKIVLSKNEMEINKITTFYEIEPYIKRLQSSHQLSDYGKYSTLPEEGDCYILVYNKEGKVVSKLHRNGSGTQLNLSTLQEDNVKNYKNCGAIWLQIK